jgi:hypothetical protein
MQSVVLLYLVLKSSYAERHFYWHHRTYCCFAECCYADDYHVESHCAGLCFVPIAI